MAGVWARLWAAGYEYLGVRAERVNAPHRQKLVAGLEGDVLEIGAGTGFNFPYYRGNVRVVAVEPADAMRGRAERRARKAPVPIDVRPGDAQRLEFQDACFDAVVFGLVLCSVPDQARALTEARRVLRPDGQIRFFEHVRSQDQKIARRQDRWTGVWRAVNQGCHPNRETVAEIERAGFRVTKLESFDTPGLPSIVKLHVLGTATAS